MHSDLDSLQEIILSKMGFEDPVEPESDEPIPFLSRIVSSDPASVQLALGKFGQKICSFASAVDLKHPHVRTLFIELLKEDEDLLQDVDEMLQLSDFAIKNGITKVLSNLGGKVINREKLSRTMLRTIDSPFNNRCRIRLLKSRKDRDRLRAEKRMQPIDMTAFSKKGGDIWHSQPDHFESFIRFGVAYKDEIEYAEKKMNVYLKHGCTGLAKYINDCIQNFKAQLHESYYGFNRITMTNTAVILAKSLRFKLFTIYQDSSNENTRYKIKVPDSFFGKAEKIYTVLRSTGEPVVYRRQDDSMDYEPRVYPLSKLWHLAPPSVVRVIEHLEAFPQACGKAIFDNYTVIIPGPSIGGNVFLDDDDVLTEYESREAACFACDKVLIKRGKVSPVLLGEKDGKCFFICFWR